MRRQHHVPSILAFFVLALALAIYLHTLLLFSPPLETFGYVADYVPSDAASSACHLPELDPWDPTVLPYVFSVPPLTCPPVSSSFTIEQDPDTGSLLFLTSKNASSLTVNVNCRYRDIVRGSDDFSVEFGSSSFEIKAFPFKWPNNTITDFIEITCSSSADDGQKIYSDVFANIKPVTPPVAQQRRAAISSESWNVLIVGVDSVSQLNFARSLPKTLKKLKAAGAVILKGYNKIGENTFPNLVPVLTGQRVELLPGEPLSELPHDGSNGETFDDYPFIWKPYQEAGYVTMYTEDMPRIGTFHWQKKGFKHKPTDHFGRPLFLAMEKLHPLDSILNPVLQFLETKDLQLTASPSLCFQGRKKHNIFWNYAVRQFVSAYTKRSQPYFGLTWLGEPSHDHVNLISICDEDLSQLVDWLRTNVDDRTFVFVMSDHGARFDNIRNTLVGRIEDRMPFFSILVPSAFKNTYPHLVANLRQNTERLTTPLDFHQTLKHLLHLSLNKSCTEGKATSKCQNFPRAEYGSPHRWASSLFAEVIPATRSCWQANIPEHYCACYRESPIVNPNSDSVLTTAARFVVESVNTALETVYKTTISLSAGTKCATLLFDGIESASRVGAGKSVVHDVQRSQFGNWIEPGRQIRHGASSANTIKDDYVIVTRAKPSDALFEAHVRRENTNSNKWTIVGVIQRINAYGNQSWCISGSSAAKKFCFCT